MKKWYQSKMIWMGLIALVTAAGDAVVEGSDWKTVLIAAVGALVTLFRLGTTKSINTKSASTMLSSMLIVMAIPVMLMSCGSSVRDLPISDKQKVAIAIEVGCIAAASAGCLEDESVNELFGRVKTSTQCVASVTEAVDTLLITVDIGSLTGKRFTCKRFMDSFLPAPEPTSGNENTQAVWDDLAKQFDTTIINRTTAIGKATTDTVFVWLQDITGDDMSGQLEGVSFCFWEYVVVPFEPGTGALTDMQEYMLAVHEFTHRWQEQRDGVKEQAIRYVTSNQHRKDYEVEAILGALAIEHVLTGKMHPRHGVASLSSDIYRLDTDTIKQGAVDISKGVETIQAGEFASPVVDCAVGTLQRRGLIV